MRKTTKKDFVNALPPTLPVADVVKKAKAAGVKISTQHVYNIRAKAKKEATNGGANRHRKPAPTVDKAAQLERLVVECGLDTAKRVIESVSARGLRLVG